jgi:hypothetical protein
MSKFEKKNVSFTDKKMFIEKKIVGSIFETPDPTILKLHRIET